jgi:putative endonuclease
VRQFHVYILSSRSGVLYVGMTNNIDRRIVEHKEGRVPGFTSKYRVNRLVWCEAFPTALQAIEAEKRIKGWTRAKKIALIEDLNPQWRDLSENVSAGSDDDSDVAKRSSF